MVIQRSYEGEPKQNRTAAASKKHEHHQPSDLPNAVRPRPGIPNSYADGRSERTKATERGEGGTTVGEGRGLGKRR